MEPPLYEKAGIDVRYVGHPMADRIPLHTDKQAVRAQLNLPLAGPIYALLPGSRQSEVEALAETFVRTAALLHAREPLAVFVVPLATRETRLCFEAAIYRLGLANLPFRLLFGHAEAAMGAADAVLVASGTATLEAALLKRPMVITYKLAPTTYRLMKRRAYLPYVGLPNVLAGRFLVPEILQDDATPENLAQALGNVAADPRIAAFLGQSFTRLHLSLRQDNAAKAAEAVIECLPN
jgi:lipid-A-disaccharide synthase